MASAKDIVRKLWGRITVGDKVIELTSEAHNSMLIALMNLATSTAGNSDATKSAEMVLSFIDDIKVSDLEGYSFEVGDGIKTARFNGTDLRDLSQVWGSVVITWHVSRGGKRQASEVDTIKLAEL